MGELFEVQTGDVDLQQKDCNGKGVFLVNSGIENCGIKGRTDYPAHIFQPNTITIDFWGNAFYRSYPYKMATHNHVFSLSGDVIKNERVGMFIITQLSYMRKLFSYNYMGTWNKIKEMQICLPQTSDGEIDFKFMEGYISEIEYFRLQELKEMRIRKIEAYLHAAELKDYHLTEREQSVLTNFQSLQWKEFCINDLFEKVETIKLPYKAKELPKQPIGKYSLPCLTSSFMNQGLNYYAPRERATILSNVISIPSNSDVYRAYYQPNDFTVLSDAYAIRWKDEDAQILPLQYLFMVACINRVTDLPIYSYKNKLGGWNVVKKKQITFPVTANGKPDFAAMEQFIAVLQKVVIADVAKYTSQRIDATRHIIESEQIYQAHGTELNMLEGNKPETESVSLMAAEPFECYKWNGFDRSLRDFFDENQTILIGCYKGKKYQEWIHSHNIYNIRLGKTKGSMEANRELFDSASLLVLYELGKTDKLSAYKITGHHEITKDELMKLDYPNKKPRKSYMAFDIAPLEKDLTFLVEHHLIERLVELNANNEKGTPVFIEP